MTDRPPAHGPSGPPTQGGDTAGDVISDALEFEVRRETDRRSSLQSRAQSALTATSIIVTAFFGLFTWLKVNAKIGDITSSGRWQLQASLFLVVLSALANLIALGPKGYPALNLESVKAYARDENYFRTGESATRRVVEVRLEMLEMLQVSNRKLARLLFISTGLLGVATVLLATVVASVGVLN